MHKLPMTDCRSRIEISRLLSPPKIVNRQSSIVNSSAFSLIEIMAVVALLAMIILGLTTMFNQTQRAFRTGMNQVDVLEGGRMATDMIAREMAQAAPSYTTNYNPSYPPSVFNYTNNINFYTKIPSDLPQYTPKVFYTPLVQSLPGSDHLRTNVVEDVFFLIHGNQTWTGVGYFVRTNNTFGSRVGVVGSLYRFETNVTALQFRNNPSGLFNGYLAANNASKILDGVVHFRVRAYDNNGMWIAPTNDTQWASPTFMYQTNIVAYPSSVVPGEVGYYAFYSNAMPASVELEIGILETPLLEKVKAIGVAAAQTQFLGNQAGGEHLFRRQIPIQNVDRSVYP